MLIKGSPSSESIIGLPTCGWQSHLTVAILILICYLYTRHIFMKHRFADIRKEELGFVFKKEEDRVNKKYFKSALYIGFAAGCIGGMLGIGGSILLIPVWRLSIGIGDVYFHSIHPPLIWE